MSPTPPTIVSGWFLLGVGQLSVMNCSPDFPVTSSKRMVLLPAAGAQFIRSGAVVVAGSVRGRKSPALHHPKVRRKSRLLKRIFFSQLADLASNEATPFESVPGYPI